MLTKMTGPGNHGEYSQRSTHEGEIDAALRNGWMDLIPRLGDRAWQWDQLVLLKRQVLSRILYFDELYRAALPVQGIILEMGTQWGAGLSTLLNLRSIYEPYNHARTIVGFDTFAGFSSLDDKDGGGHAIGDYGLPDNWQESLEAILSLHEANAPIAHKRKFELVGGDVSETVPEWLQAHPEAIVAMAIFDMDVYRPTKDALEHLLPRLTRGSVLVFDELNCPHFPGETVALREVLGLNRLRLRSHPHQPYCSWAVFGED